MNRAISRTGMAAKRMRGVTLIELMIALVIGLIVTGAALALFLTNRQTYLASESIGRVQEHARTAFELMSRDLRDAAGNACPSLHVAFAVFSGMWLERVLKAIRASWVLRVLNVAWCAGITYATLATKQHVVVDVVAGALLGGIVGAIGLSRPMDEGRGGSV